MIQIMLLVLVLATYASACEQWILTQSAKYASNYPNGLPTLTSARDRDECKQTCLQMPNCTGIVAIFAYDTHPFKCLAHNVNSLPGQLMRERGAAEFILRRCSENCTSPSFQEMYNNTDISGWNYKLYTNKNSASCFQLCATDSMCVGVKFPNGKTGQMDCYVYYTFDLVPSTSFVVHKLHKCGCIPKWREMNNTDLVGKDRIGLQYSSPSECFKLCRNIAIADCIAVTFSSTNSYCWIYFSYVSLTSSTFKTYLQYRCDQQCGVPDTRAPGPGPSPRIVDGQPAASDAWPWYVQVDTGDGLWGGSIIGSRVVLTAVSTILRFHNSTDQSGGIAHVIDPSDVTVIVNGTGSRMRVWDYRSYNEGAYRDTWPEDMAMLLLQDDIHLTRRSRRVCLPTNLTTELPPPLLQCVMVGFESTQDGPDKVDPKRLMQTNVTLRNCKYTANENVMCSVKHTHGACAGDVGGPMMCVDEGVWTQQGVISYGSGKFGFECNGQTTFTSTAALLNWIKYNMFIDNYVVTVYTKDEAFAGTSATIHILFFGRDHSNYEVRTNWILLDNADDNFERGDVDVFSIDVHNIWRVGQIRLRVRSKRDSWKLDKVVVSNRVTGLHTRYNCNCWLPENGNTIKKLNPAS